MGPTIMWCKIEKYFDEQNFDDKHMYTNIGTCPICAGHITVWEPSIKHLHYCLTACTFKLHVASMLKL